MNSWDRFVVFGNTLYYTAGSSSGQDEANLTWVLIGYPNGQDGPIFLAREFPLCSRKKKISWSYVKAAVKQSNLPGIKDSYLRGSNFCVLPFPKWNCRRVRGRDIVVGTLYASKSPEQNNCPCEGAHSSKGTFYELTILERSNGSQSLWANISHSVNETVSTVSLGQLLVFNLAALTEQSCWRLFLLALSWPDFVKGELRLSRLSTFPRPYF